MNYVYTRITTFKDDEVLKSAIDHGIIGLGTIEIELHLFNALDQLDLIKNMIKGQSTAFITETLINRNRHYITRVS